MNLELSSAQRLLRDSAAGQLGRMDTLASARAALDAGEATDNWDIAERAGWVDLLAFDDPGDAGLFDAMLVLEQCGSTLASSGLIGYLPARALLAGTTLEEDAVLEMGRLAVAFAPLGEPGTVWAGQLSAELNAPDATTARLSGEVNWIVDGPHADGFLVGSAGANDRVFLLSSDAPGVTVTDVTRYDSTRPLARVALLNAEARVLGVDLVSLTRARFIQHALLASEAIGTANAALAMATAYAHERHTFGRSIGSYQGVKHRLVEIVRLVEAARSLIYRTAWADEQGGLEDFVISACAARAAGERACSYAVDQNLYLHGGIGATWDHDAHLLYRRSQVSSRLLGGPKAASRLVAQLMISPAGSEAADESGAVLENA